MNNKIQLSYADTSNDNFILELFNSDQFLKNGMRRTTKSSLLLLEKNNLYFDYDTGNGYLIFTEEISLKRIGAIKVCTSLRNQVATMSGGIMNEYFGSNYSKESLIEAMKFMFFNYPIARIEMNILDSNHRSLRFHDKMGFIREGIKRKAWFCNGQLQDQVIMGLLREEFSLLYGNQVTSNLTNYSELCLQ